MFVSFNIIIKVGIWSMLKNRVADPGPIPYALFKRKNLNPKNKIFEECIQKGP